MKDGEQTNEEISGFGPSTRLRQAQGDSFLNLHLDCARYDIGFGTAGPAGGFGIWPRSLGVEFEF